MPSDWRPVRAITRLACAAIGAGLALAAPLRAEFLPTPDTIALPGEQVALREAFLESFDDPAADRTKLMASLDAALARLGQPTKLRGFFQFLRASALWASDRNAAAREAVDESVRLLPGYSGPLLVAAEFYSSPTSPRRPSTTSSAPAASIPIWRASLTTIRSAACFAGCASPRIEAACTRLASG